MGGRGGRRGAVKGHRGCEGSKGAVRGKGRGCEGERGL